MKDNILKTSTPNNMSSGSKSLSDPNEKMLHTIISAFLISFAGWTIAVHVCVLLDWNLKVLLMTAPFTIIPLFALYNLSLKPRLNDINNETAESKFFTLNCKPIVPLSTLILIAIPAILYWSWMAFWTLSILVLVISLLSPVQTLQSQSFDAIRPRRKLSFLVISLVVTSSVVLAYAISRSDLDDAFYVAIAAFSSSHPEHPLLASDPMLGEPSLPLIFPSYRFASFELLSGALAHLFSVPAMDIYYIYLLPVWVIASVAATFLLTKELLPRSWIMAGAATFLLTLLLGEMPRGTANFSFVRLFQGKAVFLSVIVPTIFYLTARYFSIRGTRSDLFLLACCQLAAIGLSNFGMLAGPMAGFGALLSNAPLALKGEKKKYCYTLAIIFIPLPYLINVALQLKGSPMMNYGTELAENVWTSVFGAHQQYLVGILLLAGPILARDTITKWRLAVPPLMFFAIYLNPWLSGFISRYVTTPPVYWRMVWSLPILTFSAVSLCMIASELHKQKRIRPLSAGLFAVVLGLIVYALPFNTLRPENIGKFENFAEWKIPAAHLLVAQKGISMYQGDGRLLAPDEIAGVISRFEQHPMLVSTRALYLDLLKPAEGSEGYAERRTLYNFVTGTIEGNGELVRAALQSLDISLIILGLSNESSTAIELLGKEGYKKRDIVNGYSFWLKEN